MTEWQNHRIPEGQGKSSIAPTFSKRGYKNRISLWICISYTGYRIDGMMAQDFFLGGGGGGVGVRYLWILQMTYLDF